MTTNTEELVRERRGPVLIVRLNRPDARNALTPRLLSGIGAAVLEAESDPDIRVVVLTGTGDRAFCAGMDLRAFGKDEKMGDDSDEATAAYQRLIQGELTVPVIGAANGTAVGGGLELLLGCDLIVASEEAKFGFPEVQRGLFAAGGGVFIGTRIPLGIALELLLTGDTFDAHRAYEIGLVNAIAAPGDVLDTAVTLAERVADNAPLGLAASKELARLGITDARASTRMKEWQSKVFTSADAKEGAAAFVEKRKPVWQGR